VPLQKKIIYPPDRAADWPTHKPVCDPSHLKLIYKSLSPLALKPDLKQTYLKDIPAGRVATPDEVADAALFLATNSYANNCVLNLDGGLSAA
jgi:NAD(P)-dependent dehydrogenase (short-subunit alcohol dehydrogenase family)